MNVNAGRTTIASISVVALFGGIAARLGGRAGIAAGLPGALLWACATCGVALLVVVVVGAPATRMRRRLRRRYPNAIVFNSSRRADGLNVLEQAFGSESPSAPRFSFTVLIDDSMIAIFTGLDEIRPRLTVPLHAVDHAETIVTNVLRDASVPALQLHFEPGLDVPAADFVISHAGSFDVLGHSFSSTERWVELVNDKLAQARTQR